MLYRVERPEARYFKEVRYFFSNYLFISSISVNTHVGVMIILMIIIRDPCDGTAHGSRIGGGRKDLNIFSVCLCLQHCAVFNGGLYGVLS